MPLSTKVLEEKRAFRVGDSENVGCEKVRRWVVRRSGLWTEVSIKWLDGMKEDGETEDLASSSGRISTRFSSSSSNNSSRMHSNTRSSSSSMEGRRVVMANSNGNQSGTRPMSLVVVEAISAGKKCPLIKLL